MIKLYFLILWLKSLGIIFIIPRHYIYNVGIIHIAGNIYIHIIHDSCDNYYKIKILSNTQILLKCTYLSRCYNL